MFPTNFPDEFFYASATSENVPTAGCAGTAPGRALVTLALEGAFVNGDPAAGEQMAFGRIRVRVTSGLCPNTTYEFRHPFGTETFTTDEAGAHAAERGHPGHRLHRRRPAGAAATSRWRTRAG